MYNYCAQKGDLDGSARRREPRRTGDQPADAGVGGNEVDGLDCGRHGPEVGRAANSHDEAAPDATGGQGRRHRHGRRDFSASRPP